MDDNNFRFHFRMTRSNFWELVGLLKDHQVFKKKNSDSRGPAPKDASRCLLVLLKCHGCDGNQGSSRALAHFFGVGTGEIDACRANGLQALLSLEKETSIWPNFAERKAISAGIKDQWLFPNCIGLIDGTLLPLAAS